MLKPEPLIGVCLVIRVFYVSASIFFQIKLIIITDNDDGLCMAFLLFWCFVWPLLLVLGIGISAQAF